MTAPRMRSVADSAHRIHEGALMKFICSGRAPEGGSV